MDIKFNPPQWSWDIDCPGCMERAKRLEAELSALKVQLAAAREALERYGLHESGCRREGLEAWQTDLSPKVKCTCGLGTALATTSAGAGG